MTEPAWARVDAYVEEQVNGADTALEATLAAASAADLPPIQVTPAQGKLLHLLVRLQGARTVLEIGTLAGYSTIWLARALPAGGRLVSLEIDPRHAEIARANLDRAGLSGVADVRLGPALSTLPGLAAEGPFDFVFIDADKPSNPDYVRWALRLTRPGSTIVVDNVVRNGAVADADSTDPAVVGSRRTVQLMAAEPRLDATVIQTVGAKGYDGFALALVIA